MKFGVRVKIHRDLRSHHTSHRDFYSDPAYLTLTPNFITLTQLVWPKLVGDPAF